MQRDSAYRAMRLRHDRAEEVYLTMHYPKGTRIRFVHGNATLEGTIEYHWSQHDVFNVRVKKKKVNTYSPRPHTRWPYYYVVIDPAYQEFEVIGKEGDTP